MTDKMIHLGFEIGSGEPVEIPLRHMAVTGQTQQSGKTTTLEALITRAGGTALTFVTKRGEGSFEGGHRVQPYFRDRADWQFVDQLLEAILGEKNKMLRAPIIKICRNTKTLADVQREVKEALLTARGFYEGAFTQLDAYLELIVPEIAGADLAKSLDLKPGINVMDVSGFRTPMQMLFIQSALDWINEHGTHTTVVIPEAWEFAPEGKGSPVKDSAVTLVRKGAAQRIQNHIWLDSQDMAGVDKTILRGCTVWLIGVQREANEIKRNLLNIPAGMKRPRPEDIAGLERGQFFACFGKVTVKVYVQPAWMSEEEAKAIARGDLGIGDASPPPPPLPPSAQTLAPAQEDEVDTETARALTKENERLKGELAAAEERGYEQARQDASKAIAESIMGIGMALQSELSNVGTNFVGRLAETRLAAVGPFVQPTPQTEQKAAEPAAPKPPAKEKTPRPPADPSAGPSQHAMRLLDVLVRSHPQPLDADHWGVFAGVAPSGGNWNAKLKQLRDAGFVATEDGGYSATAAGRDASDAEPSSPKTKAELYGLWRDQIRGVLGSSALSALSHLVLIFPRKVTLEQWGLLVQRATTGGNWNAALKVLKDWGCVEGAEGRYGATDLAVAITETQPTVGFNLAGTLRKARIDRLSGGAQRLHSNLTDGITKQELADRIGVKATGGNWNAIIKEFLESGLVEQRGGQIFAKAEDLGFEKQRSAA